MRILIYGVSSYMQHQLCKRNSTWNLKNVDFTDSNPQKWDQTIFIGKESYKIQPVTKIKAEDYDWCVIGCVAYETSIRDSARRMGFPDTKILPAVFWESHFASWRKMDCYDLWANWISGEHVQVIKNWFFNGNRIECVVQIRGCTGYHLDLGILQLVGNHVHFKIKRVNTGEEWEFSEDEKKSLYLDSDNELLIISAELFVTIQPFWMLFNLEKTEQQTELEREKRYRFFSPFWERMQRFEYHDEDYLALRKFSDWKGTVLDLGANYGQSMYAFYKLLPNAKIISVEAVPELASILRKCKERIDADGRIEIINVGLSDTDDDTLVFYEPKDCMICGSFDKTFVEGFQTDTTKFEISEKELQCRTLDSLFRDLDDIFFIKMDVEGLEYQALSGGLEIIKRNRPVLLLEANVDYQLIEPLLGEDYLIYNYVPEQDRFVSEPWANASINYWMIPKKFVSDNGELLFDQ